MAPSVGDLVEGRVVHIQDARILVRLSPYLLELSCFARFLKAQLVFYEVSQAFQTSREEGIWLELPLQSAWVPLHGELEDPRLGDELTDLVVDSLHQGSGSPCLLRRRARRRGLCCGARHRTLQPREVAGAALAGEGRRKAGRPKAVL